jgi:putative transposase
LIQDKGIGVRELVTMTDRDSLSPPMVVQAKLLGIGRSSIYFRPQGLSSRDQELMKAIDELYTAYPFYGSRKLAKELGRQRKEQISRKCIQRLMRIMGIEAIYPKPNLSQNNAPHPIFPYLLRNLTINHSNQVWSTDITYIRLKHGFVYLVAIIDWYSRLVLASRLSTTMEAGFCVEVAKEAIKKYGCPEIINSDQGVQFTSEAFINVWKEHQVTISMDGRGRALDNIFVERLWRSLKYENIYLNDYETVAEARLGIDNYFTFYNTKRIHQSLNYQTPNEVHFQQKN